MVSFFVSLISFLVIIGVGVFAFIKARPIIGAGTEYIITIITFLIPYLHKKGTLSRWWEGASTVICNKSGSYGIQ